MNKLIYNYIIKNNLINLSQINFKTIIIQIINQKSIQMMKYVLKLNFQDVLTQEKIIPL